MAAPANWASVFIRDAADLPRAVQIATLQGGVVIKFDRRISSGERAEVLRQLREVHGVNFRMTNSNYNKAGLIAVGVVAASIGVGVGLGLTGLVSWRTLKDTLKQTAKSVKLLGSVAELVTEIQAINGNESTLVIVAPPPQ